MPAFARAEIWSDYQYAGGTRQAVLPREDCRVLTTTERVERDDEGTLELSKDAPAAEHLAIGRVVRLVYADGSFDEWRVRQLQDSSRTAAILRATLQSPLLELATGAAVITKTTATVVSLDVEWKGLTATEIATEILTFCPSGWSLGTVDPTIPVNLTASAWMPLRALRELVSAVRAQGVDCELTFRRNGTTGYYVDLVTTIGASAGTIDVRSAKNLLSTTRTRDRDAYGTEVVPLGTGQATLARAFLEVTAKSGSTLTLQSPVTGGQVIAFDGQYDGLYLIDDVNAKQLVSASGVDQECDVASAANFTVGRWYRLARNSSGDEMVGIRKAPGTAGPVQIITSAQLDDTTNHVANPSQRTWTGASSAPPDGWTTSGTVTLTRTTTTGLWVYGGKSCRVQASGGHLQSPTTNLYIPTWVTHATLSAWVYVTTASTGEVRFVVNGSLVSSTTLASLGTGTWRRVDYTHSMSGLTGAVRAFYAYVGLGVSDCYVDSVQLTLTDAARDFVEGSNPTRLLTFANKYLLAYSDTPVAYQIQFGDLQAWDPEGWSDDEVSLGMTARVRDVDLDITTSARVRELTRNHIAPLTSAVTVANRPPDLISLLSGIAA